MSKYIKDVPGYVGIHLITSCGELYGSWRNIFRKPSKDTNGYSIVSLYNRKTKRGITTKIHRLVATAFIPNPDNKPQVNHKNGIKTDNRVENLEWVTAKENVHHAHKLGIVPPLRGEENGWSKLTNDQVIEMRQLRSQGVSITKIANKYKMDRSGVWKIVTHRYWKHI